MAFSRVSLTYAIIGNIGLVSTEWTTTPTSTGVNMTTVTKKYGPVDVSTPSGLVAMEEYQRTIDLLADVILQATTPGGSRFQLAKRVLVSLNDRVDRLELAVRPREEQSTLNLSLYSEDSQAPILAVKNASLGKDWLQAREPVGKLLGLRTLSSICKLLTFPLQTLFYLPPPNLANMVV
ncbi:hypothetical protein FRC09_013125 [Ceratobasidium sp. 395]|nr:hypothetical protein FRC09_013125 [Ceratobasidium sp. 395]